MQPRRDKVPGVSMVVLGLGLVGLWVGAEALRTAGLSMWLVLGAGLLSILYGLPTRKTTHAARVWWPAGLGIAMLVIWLFSIGAKIQAWKTWPMFGIGLAYLAVAAAAHLHHGHREAAA
jgi:hypothetical protein